MDEDIFRNYFVKLYKSLARLEADYLKVLSKTERAGFLVMTESLKDLAGHFKC
jgi:DNA polymerase I-like protein with 3'-5' exonuclease and polymerase domains